MIEIKLCGLKEPSHIEVAFNLGIKSVGLVLYSQKSQEEDHMNYLFMKDKNIFNKAFRWIQNNF